MISVHPWQAGRGWKKGVSRGPGAASQIAALAALEVRVFASDGKAKVRHGDASDDARFAALAALAQALQRG